MQADLLDRPATAALVPAAAAALGRPLTVLVNNASIFEYDTIATATWESWDRHIGSNLRAPFELIQAFAAQAPKAGRDADGRAGGAGRGRQHDRPAGAKLTPEFATYTIAKMGLWALTRTAAQGLAPDVRVNAHRPRSDAARGAPVARRISPRQRAATVLGRGADPRREIAAALGFILDSPGLTGQLICHRRRAASRLADRRCARGRIARWPDARSRAGVLDFSTPDVAVTKAVLILSMIS